MHIGRRGARESDPFDAMIEGITLANRVTGSFHRGQYLICGSIRADVAKRARDPSRNSGVSACEQPREDRLRIALHR